MQLNLEPEEASVLKQILSNHLKDLRSEVYKTERYEWRQALKQDEEIIKRLLSQLEDLTTAAT
jgi:hypothetical protein